MRSILLVARREYSENVKTKGFWIGMCLLPVMLFLSARIPILLEQKGTPTRRYVLVDQSAGFERVIEERLEKTRQAQMLEALNNYASLNAASAPPGPPASLPAPGLNDDALRKAPPAASPLDEFKFVNPRSVEAFIAEGGKDYFLEQLKPRLKSDAPPFQEPRRLFQRVPLPAGLDPKADLPSIVQALKPYLRGEKRVVADGKEVELSAAILIPAGVESLVVRPGASSAAAPGPGAKAIQFWSANLSDARQANRLPGAGLEGAAQQAVNQEIRRREYLARGMDAEAFRRIEEMFVPFAAFDPKKEAGRETVSEADIVRLWAPTGFVYLLWIAIFSVVQMLLTNTIEEKSSRVMEVLLSSVTAGELMLGKLFGIAAVGLTLVGGWIAAMFGILIWQASGHPGIASELLAVLKTSGLIPLFSIYFLLGYLLYGALILSLGSVCNTLKEAQNYMAMITMIMMVPLLTMMFIPKDPNGVLARVLSWIPIYTPFTMMNRVTGHPPLIDLVGTMLLLLASTAAALWMAGKVFRIGILHTGQPPRILEILRWLRR
jgi:ABC-2 type transport system permease protein